MKFIQELVIWEMFVVKIFWWVEPTMKNKKIKNFKDVKFLYNTNTCVAVGSALSSSTALHV